MMHGTINIKKSQFFCYFKTRRLGFWPPVVWRWRHRMRFSAKSPPITQWGSVIHQYYGSQCDYFFFTEAQQPQWGFANILRYTTIGRNPLDEWSAWRKRTLPDKTQHSQETDIHAPGGIRTHNPSNEVVADPRLRNARPLESALLILYWRKFEQKKKKFRKFSLPLRTETVLLVLSKVQINGHMTDFTCLVLLRNFDFRNQRKIKQPETFNDEFRRRIHIWCLYDRASLIQ